MGFAVVIRPNESNRGYLETKQHKMGHLLDLDAEAEAEQPENGHAAVAASSSATVTPAVAGQAVADD